MPSMQNYDLLNYGYYKSVQEMYMKRTYQVMNLIEASLRKLKVMFAANLCIFVIVSHSLYQCM